MKTPTLSGIEKDFDETFGIDDDDDVDEEIKQYYRQQILAILDYLEIEELMILKRERCHASGDLYRGHNQCAKELKKRIERIKK